MSIVGDPGGHRHQGEAATRMLNQLGLYHDRWPVATVPADLVAPGPLAPAVADGILAHFQGPLDALSQARGYRSRDVIRLAPDTPDIEALLANFQRAHRHTEDEVRFVVAGEGIFVVTVAGERYEVLVTAGDVLAVPAGTRHWFTLTDSRSITAVRLFGDPAGWVALYEDEPVRAKARS